MYTTEPHLDGLLHDSARPVLFRFEDGSVFAYAHRQEWIRSSDATQWGHVSNDDIISARSGHCIARRVGNVYYDPRSHEPLYYRLP